VFPNTCWISKVYINIRFVQVYICNGVIFKSLYHLLFHSASPFVSSTLHDKGGDEGDCTAPTRHLASILVCLDSCVNTFLLPEPVLEEYNYVDSGVDSDGE
jgi:hypothetical protein